MNISGVKYQWSDVPKVWNWCQYMCLCCLCLKNQTTIFIVAGAGQSINVSTADQHLLVEAGSPNVTFNADVLAGTEVPVYNDLQFQMGGVGIARPSFKPTGPVLVVNTAFQDHFEVLETTPPLASVKINNPDMKAHTQVYSWILLTGSTQDVTLIVSGEPFMIYPLGYGMSCIITNLYSHYT